MYFMSKKWLAGANLCRTKLSPRTYVQMVETSNMEQTNIRSPGIRNSALSNANLTKNWKLLNDLLLLRDVTNWNRLMAK
jgi:hypothetical protein